MVRIGEYLNDGADWQAQAILAYLRSHISQVTDLAWNPLYGMSEVDALVGRYENGREQGYVVSLLYKYREQKTIAFYEHRNSDVIYVLSTDKYVGYDTPNKEIIYDGYGDKWDCDESFKCGEIVKCGEYIINEFTKFVSEAVKKDAHYFDVMKKNAEEVNKIREKAREEI